VRLSENYYCREYLGRSSFSKPQVKLRAFNQYSERQASCFRGKKLVFIESIVEYICRLLTSVMHFSMWTHSNIEITLTDTSKENVNADHERVDVDQITSSLGKIDEALVQLVEETYTLRREVGRLTTSVTSRRRTSRS
jgi:hypothetical protein